MALVIGTNCGFVPSAPSADPSGPFPSGIDDSIWAFLDPTSAGITTITEIGFWADNATQEANFEVGIYEDNAGTPGNVVGSLSQTNAKGTTAGWKKATGLSISVSASTNYWIAVQLDNTATTTNIDFNSNPSWHTYIVTGAATLPSPWSGGADNPVLGAIYAVESSGAPAGTNMQINIADAWKAIASAQINIGDAWKAIASAKINIGDAWKTIF